MARTWGLSISLDDRILVSIVVVGRHMYVELEFYLYFCYTLWGIVSPLCLFHTARLHPVCVRLPWPILCFPAQAKFTGIKGINDVISKDYKERPTKSTVGRCEDNSTCDARSARCPLHRLGESMLERNFFKVASYFARLSTELAWQLGVYSVRGLSPLIFGRFIIALNAEIYAIGP